MKSQNSACITLLVFLICSLLIFPVISFGQDTERDDTLKPYTSCHFDNGLRIIQIDSLPKNVKSRPIKTTTGNKKVSLADGYRIMVSYKNSSDWFANIKAEKSFAADYEQDKENVIENLKWTTSNEKGKVKYFGSNWLPLGGLASTSILILTLRELRDIFK